MLDFPETLLRVIPYLLPLATLIVGWLIPSPRQRFVLAVLKVAFLVEKYLRGASEKQLEEEAVALLREVLPDPEEVIRAGIREACALRKETAIDLGIRRPNESVPSH